MEARRALSAVPRALVSKEPAAPPLLELEDPLATPVVGTSRLRILSPLVLELSLVTTKPPDGPVEQWDFVGADSALSLPSAGSFRVIVDGARSPVRATGFKRRALYAPRGRRDLRIESSLYLELERPIPEKASVEVESLGAALWRPDQRFAARADRARFSPAIHVNQVGYVPGFSKTALVGYFIGSLGELDVPIKEGFQVIEAGSGREVFRGELVPRKDTGFTTAVQPYQRVFEADFSDLRAPGELRLLVPGLGASYPFTLDEGAAAAFARTYALGLYHQRCGAENALPFTRFTHGPCHTAPADVPVPSPVFAKVEAKLAGLSESSPEDVKRAAPPLQDLRSSLYPMVRTGKIDVSGGHHDAGDYSKYTVNSAQLIHHLVFAADSLAGAGDLDNLGLPESGDGISDLLQIAKWEADFLVKMQDADGGFYFLVYPRDRSYESDVLPDHGDPQVVFPKNTAATAAAVAALAQSSTSPGMRRAFPEASARYRRAAEEGWRFLKRAIAAHGRSGAYQKISHYGDVFEHNDELAWAATEMFLATGDKTIQEELIASFDPSDQAARRWTFWRLFEGYGAAVRSYAFAERSGRRRREELDAAHLTKCLAEIQAAAADQARYAAGSAYATSFPFESKRHRSAGWYFPAASAFDIAVAYELDPRPALLSAILGNLSFEGGANPNNVVFLTGLGWKRQREIVHQLAMNDRRALPPSGIPIGSIQSGPPFIEPYRGELGAITFPSDGDKDAPFPMYDRWGDTFNVKTEVVAATQARALAGLAALMARTQARGQPYRAIPARILLAPAEASVGASRTARLSVDERPDLRLDAARIVWESSAMQPTLGHRFTRSLSERGEGWLEAEAQWPDGRRAFGATELPIGTGAGIDSPK